MKSISHGIFLLTVISFLIIPQTTFAAWWNPFTWKIFNRIQEAKVQKIITFSPTSTSQSISLKTSQQSSDIEKPKKEVEQLEKKPVIDTVKKNNPQPAGLTHLKIQTKTSDQSSEIEKLKKEVEELKKKPAPLQDQKSKSPASDTINNTEPQRTIVPPPTNITPPNSILCNGKYWASCPAGQRFYCPSTGDAQCLTDNISNQNSQKSIESWEQIEARDFVYADGKGWASLISTNALGEKRYYYYLKKTGKWTRAKDEKEMQELAEAARVVTEYEQNFTRPAEAPSPTQLRRLMAMCSLSDDLASICDSQTFVSGYFTNIAFRTLTDDLAQKAEKKLTEQKAQSELDQQRYLLYLQTINQQAIPPSTRYESYSLPVYSGGLKLETPQLNSPIKWTIQWTGDGGGFITTHENTDPINTTHFQCITGKCFSL